MYQSLHWCKLRCIIAFLYFIFFFFFGSNLPLSNASVRTLFTFYGSSLRNHSFSAQMSLFMLASHCPEVDTRWSYECGILNFARNSSRNLISANQQQRSLRCLPKVTRLHSNTTRRFQEGITKATRRCDFKYDIYTKAIRRSHDAVRRLHGVVL